MLKLRDARKRADYTMKELASLLGVTEGTVSNYENGKRQPDLTMLSRIADILNCSTDYLLGRTDQPDAYFLKKEIPSAEPADSSIQSETPDPSKLSAKEVQAIRRLLAERPDLK